MMMFETSKHVPKLKSVVVFLKIINSDVILTTTAFRNEFQPVSFLMENLSLSGFTFNTAGLLLRLGATLSKRNLLNFLYLVRHFVEFQELPCTFRDSWMKRCFKYHDIRYPPRAGLASSHTQWHRLY